MNMSPPSPPSSEEHESQSTAPADYRDRYEALTGLSLRECPVCHKGHMVVRRMLAPLLGKAQALNLDTS